MKKWICLLGMMTCFLFCKISVHADLILNTERIKPQTNQRTIVVVIVLVAAVVLITVVWLVLLKKRK